MRCALAAALLVSVLCPSALEAQPAFEGLFFDDLARRAYGERRYDEAYTAFAQLSALIESAGTLYNLGLCADLTDRDAVAFAHFEEYLNSDDDDQARRQDAERRLRALRERLALVRVDSRPPGGRIAVVGMDVGDWGVTPRTIAVPPGERTIRVDHERRVSRERGVTAQVGEVATVELQLPPRTGQLLVQSGPGSVVSARGPDDEWVLGAGGVPLTLGVGAWVVRVSSPGTEEARLDVQIAAGQTRAHVVRLRPRPVPTGRLLVHTYDVAATVFVDGVSRAQTPATLPAVPAGWHQVRVEAEGYRPWIARVEVRADAARFLNVTLVRAGR